MGSLFKLRDYWYNRYNREEFSHAAALTVGNIDNDPDEENKIIFGSFSGMLRVLKPTKKGAAQPEDTLVEKSFGEPILQVACRPLEPVSGGAPLNLLAVLLPKRMLLARVLREGSVIEKTTGMENSLNTSYRIVVYHEARLESSAYNFTCGTFGHASHEMVCVQSMDGLLTIVNHNAVVLQCCIPSSQFLLPGCLTYCPQRDYFLTNNSAMNLMCYSFATLTSNRIRAEAPIDSDGNMIERHHGDVMAPTWMFVLGDDVVGIEVCRQTRGLEAEDADIVVLCHYTLFVLQMNGALRYSRRLDVESLCLTSFYVPDAGAHNLLVGTVKGSVNVYSDMALEWSAKMTTAAPLWLEVAGLCGTKGMIVSLSTDGTVAVNYLGTDPEEEPIQPLESKEADYAEMEQELRRVQHTIKQVSNTNASVQRKPTTEELVRVSWETAPSGGEGRWDTTLAILSLRNDTGKAIVCDVTVLVQVVEPVQVDAQQRVLSGGMPVREVVQFPFKFDVASHQDMIIPSSLNAHAVVMYTGASGVEYTVSATMRLPLTLVARPIPPVKCPDFVMQLNTEKDVPPSLLDLFPEMASSSDITANIMSVQYVNGADATLLVSKNASRFRLQASTMEALWLLADELQQRLYTYYGSDVQLSIPDSLPLENYYRVIDTHLAVRKELLEAQEALSQAAQMFRAVQKRLLVAFREHNPAPVGMMDVLFDESFNNLQKCADAVGHAMPRQKQAAAMLCCCSRLIVLQLFIKSRETLKNPDDIRLIESIFTCPIAADTEVSWEEVTDAALGHLLASVDRTSAFTSSPAPESKNSASMSLNGGRLKKRIGSFFDRILGGSQVTFS
ncbi:Bardet-Biedl syndrome 9 [Trypanosoma grayi]|uniref:Bardet-Biedl syndrome 9 n=1 Tax=Trypanosoma grayi TaxID=71804 RepID=UPI0004F48D78|nr:Bardet-Biedl syndrome 9 [Trypanosoma grayi]KEG07352.1 Bardet-Biedl syndrome 9 [Trypanosoma grayi]